MDIGSLAKAPIRIPLRLVQALDDLSALADRARRDPDPFEELRDRLDVLLLELGRLIETTQAIVVGGAELTVVARTLEGSTRELIDGGDRLRVATEQIEAHLRAFRAALPRVMDSLDTVEQLEGAMETVAETVEPLQGAAERVGRVSRRLSRGSS
jgi:hypothetical protein